MNHYTLIVYRENKIDTCRGCYMGSSDSYHQIYYTTDADELVQTIAHYLYKSITEEKSYEYASYEFTLCINGDPNYYDEQDENLSSYQLREDLLKQATKLSGDKFKRAKEEEAAARLIEKQRTEALAREQQDKKDRETYERLKAKYE